MRPDPVRSPGRDDRERGRASSSFRRSLPRDCVACRRNPWPLFAVAAVRRGRCSPWPSRKARGRPVPRCSTLHACRPASTALRSAPRRTRSASGRPLTPTVRRGSWHRSRDGGGELTVTGEMCAAAGGVQRACNEPRPNRVFGGQRRSLNGTRDDSQKQAMTRRFAWSSKEGRGGVEPLTFRFSGPSNGVRARPSGFACLVRAGAGTSTNVRVRR